MFDKITQNSSYPKNFKIQRTLTFRCFKTLKIQQKLEKLKFILVLNFQIELIETVT